MEKTDKHMATPGAVKKPNRIWIELELPKPFTDKNAEKIATNACMVLTRMGVNFDVPVWWNSSKRMYCFTIDSGGSYVEAIDNGHWYNLDYLAEKG